MTWFGAAEQWWRVVAMTLGCLSIGGTIPMIYHRFQTHLALALLLLSASSVSEHIEKWGNPVPRVATALDIAGFTVLLCVFWELRQGWLRSRVLAAAD